MLNYTQCDFDLQKKCQLFKLNSCVARNKKKIYLRSSNHCFASRTLIEISANIYSLHNPIKLVTFFLLNLIT